MALYQSLAVLASQNGKVLVAGTVLPTSAAETVITGLSSVDFAVAGAEDAISVTHSYTDADIGDQAGAPAAGSIIIRTGKEPSVAATTPWRTCHWIAIGDR